MIDDVHPDGPSWQSPLGGPANNRTSRFPLSAKGTVRWRVALPYDEVAGISVAANGICFVSAGGGITALDGPVVRWSVDTGAAWSPRLLDDGLLVTGETDGLVVREQQTGRIVERIELSGLRSDPTAMPNGLIAFLTWREGNTFLRAATLDGRSGWERKLQGWSRDQPLVQSDHVIVADDATLRAFDGDGNPMWTVALRDVERQPGEIEVEGPLVGLPGGGILVAIRTHHMVGYAVVDPPSGEVHALPAHLPPKPLAVPLSDNDLKRELLVVPGWPEEDRYGQFLPTVTVVDIGTGGIVLRHVLPSAIRGMVAGSTGLVAVAGSPTPDHWSRYHGPGHDLTDTCYVLFLDKSGVRGEWKPGKPITGPLAVGAEGDLLVAVSGELVSLE